MDTNTLTIIAGLVILPVAAWFFLRDQRLARRSIDVTTFNLTPEQLEHLFVQCLGNKGEDGVDYLDGAVLVQPRHMKWCMKLQYEVDYGVAGEAVLLADVIHESVQFVPFPEEAGAFAWQVVERWDDLGPRLRKFMKAVAKADPDAEVKTRQGTFQPR